MTGTSTVGRDPPRFKPLGENDMTDAQLKNGLVPNIAPEYTVFDGTFRAATERRIAI